MVQDSCATSGLLPCMEWSRDNAAHPSRSSLPWLWGRTICPFIVYALWCVSAYCAQHVIVVCMGTLWVACWADIYLGILIAVSSWRSPPSSDFIDRQSCPERTRRTTKRNKRHYYASMVATHRQMPSTDSIQQRSKVRSTDPRLRREIVERHSSSASTIS